MKLKRGELLNCCRYYKGEDANPFSPGIQSYLWKVERDWLEREIGDAKSEALSEESSEIMEAYRAAGLIDFEKSDGIWVGLKASLYRLLQHWNEGVASSEDWMVFYEKWKKSNF